MPEIKVHISGLTLDFLDWWKEHKKSRWFVVLAVYFLVKEFILDVVLKYDWSHFSLHTFVWKILW